MTFAALLSYKTLLPFAVFGLFAAVAWWLLEMFAGKAPKAEQRLEDIKDPTRRRKADAVVKDTSAVGRVLEKAQPLAKPLQPKTEKEAGALETSLIQGGFRSDTAPSIYLGLKFMGLIVGLMLFGGPMLMLQGPTKNTLMYTVIAAGGMFYLPTLFVWFMTKRRKDAIFYALPDALDLMVVCVEAGLSLDQAMRKVAEEMQTTFRVLADEFATCNFQLQMGRPRVEVLQDLSNRTGVDDLRSLAAILIQADKFGSSIAQALRVQSDAMRTRRRQLAEEKAAKTAVKLIFPLVMFIFPGIFVVLVGPAAIQMIREMLPRLGGH